MAKSISISVDHEFTTGRGETESVGHALKWLDDNMSDEDGNTMEPGDLIVYAVRRLRALHKDGKRHAKGLLASRLYAPRLDMVEHAPKGLAAAVESIDTIAEKLAPSKKEPAKKAAKKEPTKAAPKASAKKEPTAKPPSVRKVVKPTKADKGGANLAI